MNILWILENNTNSANFKIGANLARVMSEKHNIYCALLGGNEYGVDNSTSTFFREVRFVGGIKSKELFVLYDNSWREKSRNVKVRYLITHPKIILHKIKAILAKNNNKILGSIEAYCKDKNIDVVVGVVMPYDIALYVSKTKSVKKKIIIQLDPYVNNFTLPQDKKEIREKEELFVIDSINSLFTTSIIKGEIVGKFPNLNNKIQTIEFPEIFKVSRKVMNNSTKLLIDKPKDSILFAYAGTLYEDIRNPKYLVELFDSLPSNYCLAVAGANTYLLHKFDSKIRDRIFDLELISQESVEQLKVEADVLINFNNLVENQVPSKLFECIETGKPFLNICQLENCPTLPYVQGCENVCNVFVDKIDPDVIIKFVETHKDTVVPRDVILARYYKHTYEYVEQQIEELLG